MRNHATRGRCCLLVNGRRDHRCWSKSCWSKSLKAEWGYVRLENELQYYENTEVDLKTYDPAISVRLGKERVERLRKYCRVLDLEMSAVIRQQVDEWLERMAPKAEPVIEAMEKALKEINKVPEVE